MRPIGESRSAFPFAPAIRYSGNLAGAVLRTAVAQAGYSLLEASFCEAVICLSSQVVLDGGQG
jgi:hypothetical protein